MATETAQMKRWRIQGDDYYDAFYVEAETEAEAIQLYRVKWEERLAKAKEEGGYWWRDYGSKMEPVPDDDLSINVVGNPDIKWDPRPSCCYEVNETTEYSLGKGPPVQLRVWRYGYSAAGRFSLEPHWVIRDVGFEISFCPFCGSRLPEVEALKEPPQPIWTGDPDDGYCDTCSERNMGCECNPPWTGYGIKTQGSMNDDCNR